MIKNYTILSEKSQCVFRDFCESQSNPKAHFYRRKKRLRAADAFLLLPGPYSAVSAAARIPGVERWQKGMLDHVGDLQLRLHPAAFKGKIVLPTKAETTRITASVPIILKKNRSIPIKTTSFLLRKDLICFLLKPFKMQEAAKKNGPNSFFGEK